MSIQSKSSTIPAAALISFQRSVIEDPSVHGQLWWFQFLCAILCKYIAHNNKNKWKNGKSPIKKYKVNFNCKNVYGEQKRHLALVKWQLQTPLRRAFQVEKCPENWGKSAGGREPKSRRAGSCALNKHQNCSPGL